MRAAAVAHGVAGNVRFVPWLPQEKLFEQYQTHDLFVYPSLHDSSGNAVLEALSFGLPVVCLDLGGPAQIVTPDCRRDRLNGRSGHGTSSRCHGGGDFAGSGLSGTA